MYIETLEPEALKLSEQLSTYPLLAETWRESKANKENTLQIFLQTGS